MSSEHAITEHELGDYTLPGRMEPVIDAILAGHNDYFDAIDSDSFEASMAFMKGVFITLSAMGEDETALVVQGLVTAWLKTLPEDGDWEAPRYALSAPSGAI